MDRFLMHVFISYPSDEAEREVVRLVRGESTVQTGSQASKPKPEAIPQQAVFDARAEIAKIQISDAMEKYIVTLVAATRRPAEFDEELAKYIQVGVSPRGSIGLDKLSHAHAWLQGRDAVTPDDIRAVINDCLRHRIVLSYEASADGVTTDDVIAKVVKLVAVA
jgi:MoxR-like ATPase